MTDPTVIAIHGVGDAEPGSIINSLAKTLASESSVLNRGTLVVSGQPYEALHSDAMTYAEMNWADVQRPTAGSIGLIRHLLHLVATCLFLGDHWQGTAPATRYFTRWYRLFVESILFWSVLVPPFSLLSISLRGLNGERTPLEIAVVVLYCFSVIAVAVTLRRLRTFARPGAVWCVLFMVSGFASLVFRLDVSVAVVAKLYCVTQLIAAALLILSVMDVLFSHRESRRPWHVRFSRIGFLTFPMLFIASVGPLLLALATILIPEQSTESGNALASGAAGWSSQFTKGFACKWHSYDIFTFDFAATELIMTLAVGAIPLLGLIGVALYFLFRTGTFARSWLLFMLITSPAILLLNSVAFFFFWSYPDIARDLLKWDVIETYRFSALRVLPFLPFLVGPLLIIFDIAGDVVFHILPEGHPLSSRATTTGRLKVLLSHISPETSEYTVYAHSQGSVIAADALSAIGDPRATLVTLGSPITSLYETFLDITPGERLAKNKWMNFYRSGDYIGGSISRANVDRQIGPGGHVDYWGDQNFKLELDTARIGLKNPAAN